MIYSKGTVGIYGPFDIPIFIHWSTLLGGIFPCLYVGFHPVEMVAFIVGFFLLVCIHEFGHATAARLFGLKVLAVQVSVAGGLCRHEQAPSDGKAFVIAASGLVAQLLLFSLSAAYVVLFGYGSARILNCLLLTFTFVNAVMFVFNLVPSKVISGLSTDGLLLWKFGRRLVKQTAHHA
jgi:Zn-dependent protease